MKIGVVTRKLLLCQSAPAMQDRSFLSVKVGPEEIAAMDCVGAGVGQTVLLLTGDAALHLSPDCMTDAAVVGIVSLDKP